jgi:hypothetical protein
MSIKLKLEEVVKAVQSGALKRLAGYVVPGSYGFRAAKLISAAEREHQEFAQQNQALVRKYGVPEERDGKPTGQITLAGASVETIKAFNDDLLALLNTETTIPYEPLVFSKLGPEVQTKLTVADIMALGPLLQDDAVDEPATAPPTAPLKSV